MHDDHHLFLICGFTQILATQLFIDECKRVPFLHHIAPRPLPKASDSKTKFLVKYGTTNTGVVHMESFKYEKACLVASFQIKELFFSSEVKGATHFP